MAWNFYLAANLAGFIEDAYRSLFDRDVQTDIMFHAALLHLMLVAAPTQTTFIINLKRSTSTFGEGHAGRPNTPSRPTRRSPDPWQAPLYSLPVLTHHETVSAAPVTAARTPAAR